MMKPQIIGLFQGLGLVEANLGSDLLHLRSLGWDSKQAGVHTTMRLSWSIIV